MRKSKMATVILHILEFFPSKPAFKVLVFAGDLEFLIEVDEYY